MGKREYIEVPPVLLAGVRSACAHLPEAYEEQAFAGVRWRIRGNTLVHVITEVRQQAAVTTTMTFHSRSPELEALVATGDPFYPGWGDGLVAMVLRDDGTTDWDEVKELLTDSYCHLAPKKLIALLNQE